jgi:transcription initiation factor TFIIF subunit beta
VGTVAHECTVTPVMNATYSKTVKSRVQEANQPKRQVQMLADQAGIPDGSYLYNPKSNQPFGKFTGGTARTKGDAQNNKATRIPKNELLDLLFKCFQEYSYWSLKGLREYVKQPEVNPSSRSLLIRTQSYLREALEEIAFLNKRGPYALKWSLKPHYSQSQMGQSSQVSHQDGGKLGSQLNQGAKVEPDIEDDVKLEDMA